MSASTTSPRKRRGRPPKAKATAGAPRFVFTGDPVNGQDPECIMLMGYAFALNGEPVEVSPAVAAKLDGHTHFKRVDDGDKG